MVNLQHSHVKGRRSQAQLQGFGYRPADLILGTPAVIKIQGFSVFFHSRGEKQNIKTDVAPLPVVSSLRYNKAIVVRHGSSLEMAPYHRSNQQLFPSFGWN